MSYHCAYTDSHHITTLVSLVSTYNFNLSKEPSSYVEAMAQPDASVWRAVMTRERESLMEMGAFEEVDLPLGGKPVGLKWVFAYNTDSGGAIIHGKEKTWLVAQGFSQHPNQYDETYAPVTKMMSVHVILGWAAIHDLDVYQFQSAFKFYMLFLLLLLAFGMIHCEVDHGIFMGKWTSSPDTSVAMPTDSSPLPLYVPLHVYDGLAVTNSHPLYLWFLKKLAEHLHTVDLGVCSKFCSILIIHNHPNHQLWLFSHIYISELLDEWNLSLCKMASTPFPSSITEHSPAPSNPLLDITDAELIPKYQLVRCLIYLAITTCPDIAYIAYVMWLGQYNANPSCSHFLVAKHILRYLSGTNDLALCYGAPSSCVPSTLHGYMQNVSCSDVDWASNATDQKVICFISKVLWFLGLL